MDAQKLLEILQELEDKDIVSFKWQLRQPDNFVGGLKPLKVAALENAKNRESLVNLIIGKYTNDAREIVMKALRKIDKDDLAAMLANIPKAAGVERPQSTKATGVDAPGKTAGPVQSNRQEELKDDRNKLTSKTTGLTGTRDDEIFEKPEYNRPGTNQDTDGPFLSKKRKDTKEDDRYKLTSKPGLCVIINNENFKNDPKAKRKGSKKDAVNLAETFSCLGFRVLMFTDLTMSQMQETLEHVSSLKDPTEKALTELQKSNVKEWSRDGEEFTDLTVGDPPQHRDAFVCCIMSHGDKGSVSGTDGNPFLVDDITTTFNGKGCPVLLNKPKVFFIQACQGKDIQCGIAADSSPGLPEAPKTPVDADFLVFMATTENNKAFRSRRDGSWFIQSLCKQLEEGSRVDKDLMAILTAVNKEMADKEVSLDQVDANLAKQMKKAGQEEGKQMSVIRYCTLRKSLVFTPISE